MRIQGGDANRVPWKIDGQLAVSAGLACVVALLFVLGCTNAESEPNAVAAAAPSGLPLAPTTSIEGLPDGLCRLVNEQVAYSFVYPCNWSLINDRREPATLAHVGNDSNARCESVFGRPTWPPGAPPAAAFDMYSVVQVCFRPLSNDLDLDEYMQQAYGNEPSAGEQSNETLLTDFDRVDLSGTTFYRIDVPEGFFMYTLAILQTEDYRIEVLGRSTFLYNWPAVRTVLGSFELLGKTPNTEATPIAGTAQTVQIPICGPQTPCFPTPTPGPPTPTPTPAPSPDPPLSLSGSGDYLSPSFNLVPGVLVLSAEHDGEGEFVVRVMGKSGMRERLGVNVTGPYSGTRVNSVNERGNAAQSPGMHRLQVTTEGNWKVSLQQPVWTTGIPPHGTYSGTGDDIIGPLLFDSALYPLSLRHDGVSDFQVTLISADGVKFNYFVWVSSPYKGDTAIRFSDGPGYPPGVYGLIVEADGAWTLEFAE